MLEDLREQWRTLADLFLICERDAREATRYKRSFRYINWIVGGVATVVVGLIITITSEQKGEFKWQTVLGYLFAGGGASAATVGAIYTSLNQYIDPEKLRQRAVELRSLKVDVQSHMTVIKIQLYIYLSKEKLEFNEFFEKYIEIKQKTNSLHQKSYEFGVKV